MLKTKTVSRISQTIDSKKTWCYCSLSRVLSDVIGESGDKSEWIELTGKRIRIKAGTKEEVFLCESLCRCSCCVQDAAA
jgi:hypothetical protein